MSIEQQTPPGPENREKQPVPPPPAPDNENGDNDDKKAEPPKDEPGAKKRFALVLGIGAAVLIVLLLVGLIPRLRARPALDKTAKENSRSTPDVDVVHPQRGPLMTTLLLPGNIEALQDTDITARASGYVSRWLVDIGDQVQAGQVLAVIDTPEVDQQVREAEANLAQSQAALVQQRAEEARAVANLAQSRQNAQRQKSQLVQAQADLNLARVTADRWLYLVKEGAVSQQSADEKVAALNNNKANVASLQSAVQASQSDIDAFQAALRASQANVGAAQAGVRASQANVKRIQALSAFRQVRAPFSGVVTARSIDAGSLIGGGSGDTGSSGGGSSAPAGGASSGGSAPAAPTGGQGANSARNGMYGSTPDTGIAAGTGNVAGGSASGDSQAASGGAGGSAGTGGTSAATAGGGTSQSGSAGGGASGSNPSSGSAGGTTGGGSAAVVQSSGAGGAAISPGVSLYHIARIDVLRIQVNVPQSFAPSVQVGNIAKITIKEYPGKEFIGKVTRTARSLDPQTRTMLTEIQISNRDKRLLPGTYGQVEFSVGRVTAPLVIPAGALIDSGKGTQVAVVGQDNKVHLAPVTVGRDYGQQIEITQGLRQEDWLVLDPSDSTEEGATVQPITPEEKQRRAEEQRQKQQAQGKSGKGGDKSGGDAKGGQGQSGGQQGQPPSSGQGGADKGGSGGASKGGPPPNLGQTYGGSLSESGRGKEGAAQGNQTGGANTTGTSGQSSEQGKGQTGR